MDSDEGINSQYHENRVVAAATSLTIFHNFIWNWNSLNITKTSNLAAVGILALSARIGRECIIQYDDESFNGEIGA